MGAASMQTEFTEILKGALALSQEDQARLCSVLQRVTGAAGNLAADSVPEPLSESERTVQDWLQQIRGEAPWIQLVFLDDALEAEDAVVKRAALDAARTQLLRDHPPLAIRRAVTDLAARHPAGVCVGALGLLIGVFGLARQVVRLLF